ncbi:MAG: glycosyltransferase family 2 protein [Spirochaetia bacterium]|nr:glycosyltransferase family 2 protein [Spirochaetia bacterium]
MKQLKLSCAIITFNEEKQIKDCIQSVHDFCDEVIVLDSHSTDRTKQIAESFSGVRFFVHDFDGHVQQKNRALDHCRGEWILSIDADERVSPELAASILKFIETSPKKGARINRLTYHMGRFIRHGGWKNARYRLIRKDQGRWGGENPHDEIFIQDQSSWKKILDRPLSGDLIHYSFTDLTHQIDTINKFSSIVAFNRNGKNKKFSLLKLLFKPPVKFIEMYLVKMGFIDGLPGFIIAVSSAFSAFLKAAKLYELQKTGLERPSNLRKDYKIQDNSE